MKEGRQVRERKRRVYRAEQNCEKKRRQRSRKNEQIMLKLCFQVAEDQNIYTKEVQSKRHVK